MWTVIDLKVISLKKSASKVVNFGFFQYLSEKSQYENTDRKKKRGKIIEQFWQFPGVPPKIKPYERYQFWPSFTGVRFILTPLPLAMWHVSEYPRKYVEISEKIYFIWKPWYLIAWIGSKIGNDIKVQIDSLKYTISEEFFNFWQT